MSSSWFVFCTCPSFPCQVLNICKLQRRKLKWSIVSHMPDLQWVKQIHSEYKKSKRQDLVISCMNYNKHLSSNKQIFLWGKIQLPGFKSIYTPLNYYREAKTCHVQLKLTWKNSHNSRGKNIEWTIEVHGIIATKQAFIQCVVQDTLNKRTSCKPEQLISGPP